MNEQVINLIDSSKFIVYLNSIGVDVTDVRKNVIDNFTEEELNIFANSHHKKLSPNIYVEDLVFKYANEYLYEQYSDSVIFEGIGKIDIRTMIATSASLVSRPRIEKPSEMVKGFKTPHSEEGFITLSRFERQFITERYGVNDESKAFIVFEGFLPGKFETNPLLEVPNTEDIWSHSYCSGLPMIQGFCANFHSIECQCVLWLNSELLDILGLMLDDYTNGLRALDQSEEVVLVYRYWREDLIDNGASFVGTNANVPKLEGCDLIIREDYFYKLKKAVPNLFFYTHLI
ncbi:hypothetical protein ACSTKA_16925 [Vibrio parahaemolyticus]|uniref:hypothetical protein n=1 Tax=Acinetobacter venetianus TaxID=52133 RepID=UPI003A8D6CAE